MLFQDKHRHISVNYHTINHCEENETVFMSNFQMQSSLCEPKSVLKYKKKLNVLTFCKKVDRSGSF